MSRMKRLPSRTLKRQPRRPTSASLRTSAAPTAESYTSVWFTRSELAWLVTLVSMPSTAKPPRALHAALTAALSLGPRS
jgi:hypothetical protein